jgi:hypothetical protein
LKADSSDAHDDGVVAYKFSTDPTNKEIKKRKRKRVYNGQNGERIRFEI